MVATALDALASCHASIMLTHGYDAAITLFVEHSSDSLDIRDNGN